MSKSVVRGCCTLLGVSIAVAPAVARSENADLAKQLANPIAALISVPIQMNWDRNIGPVDGGERFTMNVQPVVPFSLNRDWNVISRTIVPVVNQSDIYPGAGSQFGLGDTVQSVFFSPKEVGAAGVVWGAGPVFLIPTGTDELLSGRKWGAGPTGVVLKQNGPWTYGALGNHIWSFAGPNGRQDVSSTFLQPFVNYTTPNAWSFILNTESTYDWKTENWTVPVAALVAKVTKVGGQTVQFTGGPRYYLESPDSGPQGWGFRFAVTLLFPR